MTTYTFVYNPSDTHPSWSDSSIWAGGVVPNGAGADVDIPLIYNVQDPKQVYTSTITLTGSYELGQLSLEGENVLRIGGQLTVTGGVEIGAAELGVVGGALTIDGALTSQADSEIVGGGINAGTIQNAGLIEDEGSISTAGAFTNEAAATITAFGKSTINAGSLTNAGTIESEGYDLTINVAPGGLLTGGSLNGGTYYASQSGIYLNAGAVLTTDNAHIELTGAFYYYEDDLGLSPAGDMYSYSSITSQYVPIESTMNTIAAGGSLTLSGGGYDFFVFGYSLTSWEALTVQGTLAITGEEFVTPQLTVAAQGIVEALGILSGPITDNGTIIAGTTNGSYTATTSLEIAGAVTGAGTALIESALLEFDAAASANVVFEHSGARLDLGDPSQFTGSIAPGTASFGPAQIDLPTVLLSDVTGYTYTGDTSGGTLAIDMTGGTSLSLRFVGNYDIESFVFANGQTYSSSPPTLLITIEHGASLPRDDFLNQGLDDVLLENTAGQVVVGQLANGAMALTKIDTLGSQWTLVGDGDFLADGVDQIAIENTTGNVGIGQVSGSSIHFTTVATGLPATTKFVKTGDFLSHGNDQFLVETVSGQVEIGSVASGALTFSQIDTLGSQWTFVGTGDYLGLGHDQFLIENTLGTVGLGQMVNGVLHLETIDTGLTGWKIVESGDFLGDGRSDLLLDNAHTGQVEVGELNGSLTFTTIDTLGSQWSFVGADDYLGDGKDQILIENTAGSVGIGEVSNGSIHFTTVATGFSEWMFH